MPVSPVTLQAAELAAPFQTLLSQPSKPALAVFHGWLRSLSSLFALSLSLSPSPQRVSEWDAVPPTAYADLFRERRLTNFGTLELDKGLRPSLRTYPFHPSSCNPRQIISHLQFQSVLITAFAHGRMRARSFSPTFFCPLFPSNSYPSLTSAYSSVRWSIV